MSENGGLNGLEMIDEAVDFRVTVFSDKPISQLWQRMVYPKLFNQGQCTSC